MNDTEGEAVALAQLAWCLRRASGLDIDTAVATARRLDLSIKIGIFGSGDWFKLFRKGHENAE